jgi:hypothetical protein
VKFKGEVQAVRFHESGVDVEVSCVPIYANSKDEIRAWTTLSTGPTFQLRFQKGAEHPGFGEQLEFSIERVSKKLEEEGQSS